MLSEQQIEIIVEALVPLFNYLEREVIIDMAERISGTMAYTRTAELKAISMRALGYSPAKIRSECMKLLNADEMYRKAVAKNTLEHKREVRKLLNEILREAEKQGGEILKDAADTSYLNDLSIWKAAGMELTDDSYLPRLVKAFEKQTRKEFKNLSRTTAFKSVSGYEPIENAYKRELDKAIIKVCSGAFSKDEVIRDTIHNLAASGLRTVKFESGYSMNLDTAVRNAVRTGVHQMQAKMMDENIRQTGVEYVYVSKHWGARNKGTGHANHEAWQGKVYAVSAGDHAAEAKRIGYPVIEDLYETTGYSIDGSRESDPLGLHGYNCRHSHRPWFAGISDLSNFPEDPEPAPVTIGKKTYDYYAVTQKMRSMERGVRALKKEREALRAMNMDTKGIDYKIRRRTEDYKDFCKAAKVKENTERLRYECSKENLRRSNVREKFDSFDRKNAGLTRDEGGSKIVTEDNEMLLEYQRYGRNKETLINSTYINSGEYRKKFDKVSDNPDVSRVLYSKAKEMLQHRSGTMYEDMYWIDGKTGKVVASALNEGIKGKITYSESLKKDLQGKENLISMHTHPQSMPPSIDDFNSAYYHGYSKCLVLCHDGKIFAYNSKQEVARQLYLLHIGNYLDEGYTEYEAQIKTLEKIKENYDISFWEVK